ncbi:MAG TPA: HEAT repeat domain-containing protein [Planctomycetota bacterium]
MIAIALLLAPVLVPMQNETVQDFKRYYKKFEETWERVEAIRALDGIDDPAVPEVLLRYKVLTDPEPPIAAAGLEVLKRLPSLSARMPLKLILEEGKPAGEVALIARAAGEGKWQEFAPLLAAQLASNDDDVRLWAATSCGLLGVVASIPAIGALVVDDANKLVRVAAIDALGLVGKGHEDAAGPSLVAALRDDALEVQTAACLALRKVRTKLAIAELIDLMENGEGRILEHIYPTLLEITDMQFGDQPALWRNWWQKAEASYAIPSDAELDKRREARAQTNAEYRPTKKSATFMGIDTPSQRVVFVLDVSGSMEDHVVDEEAFRERGHTSFSKLEIVKEELARTIEELGGDVDFNIYAFAGKVYQWRNGLATGNSLNRRSASNFVRKLKAIGGASSGALASAGLTGSAGTDDGRTNTYAGLLAALGIELDRAGEAVTPSSSEGVRSPVDTIFFLSDGRPSIGQLVDPDDILESITELNRFRRITIHTIAIGEFQKDFMLDLARRNGGVFVDLGR